MESPNKITLGQITVFNLDIMNFKVEFVCQEETATSGWRVASSTLHNKSPDIMDFFVC